MYTSKTSQIRETAAISCPIPHSDTGQVLLAHGEGARLTRRLIREVLLQSLDNEFLRPLSDGATLPAIEGKLVMTTDSYVVSPLFFPGGDIGQLSVYGTVNDLAVSGAEPLYLSLGLIVEEGLSLATLRRVIESVASAAQRCGVCIVTGDTKVVPRGAADGLFINTTGVGRLRAGLDLGWHRIQPGDRLLVSGTIGDHGIAILSAREGLELESNLQSDTAPLTDLVRALADAKIDLHFLRDATRGGVSAVLHEIVEASSMGIIIEESALPLSPAVRGASELLGLDPLFVANEGKLIALVGANEADRALACLHGQPLGRAAALIGTCQVDSANQVLVRGPLGGLRVLDEPTGAPLPRIC